VLELLLLDGLLDGYGASRFVPLRLLLGVFLNLDLLHADGLLDGLVKKDVETLEKGLLFLVKDN
jgi:hypothetical protein